MESAAGLESEYASDKARTTGIAVAEGSPPPEEGANSLKRAWKASAGAAISRVSVETRAASSSWPATECRLMAELDDAHGPKERHDVHAPVRRALSMSSSHVPSGVSAFHDGTHDENGKALSMTGLLADALR